MWFDYIVIDTIHADALLTSLHLRPVDSHESIVASDLEKIDDTYRSAESLDIAKIRIYDSGRVKANILKSKIKNFFNDGFKIRVQIDHFNIKGVSGYYSISFPENWVLNYINLYDPYDDHENPVKKRSFRDPLVGWDEKKSIQFAQINMTSTRRQSFSVGVIAELSRYDAVEHSTPMGDLSEYTVYFTDSRHSGSLDVADFAKAVTTATGTSPDKGKIPGITAGFPTVVSADLVEWGRYLKGKFRNPSK